jgi:hypothetical protein
MEITSIQLQIWINTSKQGKKITCCEDAEKILLKVQKLLEDDGYDKSKENFNLTVK